MKARYKSAPALVTFGMKQSDSFGNGYGLSPNEFATSLDAAYQGDGYVAAANVPMPFSGVIRNLRLYFHINTLNQDIEVEIFKNGSATGVKATITASTTGEFTDLSNEIEIAAGDLIMIGTDTLTASSGNYRYVGAFEIYKP